MILPLQFLFPVREAPGHIRSDNGLEFIAKNIQHWLERAVVNTLYINKASPWENAYVKSFNGKLRDKPLNHKLFLSPAEARYVLDEWRLDYNRHRPHSSPDWQTPAAFAANFKNEDEAVGAFSAASPADPPVGVAPLPLDPPAQSTRILSQRLVQKT